MSTAAVASVQPHIASGTLRPLAVFSTERVKAFPDVPTFKELGYKIASPVYYGISAPKGTPKEVIDQIYMAAKKVNDKYSQQITENLKQYGAEVKLIGPEEYKKYLKGQNALFSEAMKGLN
jgi:tripartite-type tricarboxylate transporter receptor subunit TctC